MRMKNYNFIEMIHKKGMRFLPYSMVLFLFCGCGNQPQFITGSVPDSYVVEETITADTEKEEATSETYFVYVCGEVLSPGVYELPKNARIFEAVEAAGGMKDTASERAVNLAEPITDGLQIYVPSKEEAQVLIEQQQEKEAGLININTASSSELQTLPGIGESRAEAILDYREKNGGFTTIEDIMNVSGIKTSLFEKIKEYITV